MPDFPEQLPHGQIRELFPDIFFVQGQMKFQAPDRIVLLPRSMTIVRDGDKLTLVNTLRLDGDGLEALDRLGTVEAIVRLGANHGRDDAFYSERYGAPVWAPDGIDHTRPVKMATVLEAGNHGPLPGATVLLFESIAEPEAVLHLDRDGGILLTCDCIQNMAGTDPFIDAASSEILSAMGFFRRGNIGPAWRSRLQPDVSDYERLLALDFRHLLPAHGDALLDEAHEVIEQTVRDVFPA